MSNISLGSSYERLIPARPVSLRTPDACRQVSNHVNSLRENDTQSSVLRHFPCRHSDELRELKKRESTTAHFAGFRDRNTYVFILPRLVGELPVVP